MQDKLQQTIKEEVMKLPQEAQEAINAFGWEKIAEEIGKKYSLSEDEITNLQVETLLVLTGLTDGEFYAINIENQVNTTKADAEKMAAEALEKIFAPISNAITENIKKNLGSKKPNAEQTLNFILSSGDYTALIAPTASVPPLTRGGEEGLGRARSDSPFLAKDRWNNKEEKPTPTPIPKKMTDLKSQFKI